jgi:hypothetical protein
MADLPLLIPEDLYPTRDYIQDAAHVIGSLQRAFLPKDPHDWQYGLEVSMRGLGTQPFQMGGSETRASVDLVTHKLRLGDANWKLQEYAGPELLNNVKVLLAGQMVQADLEAPAFSGSGTYNPGQAKLYAEALWWLDRQFRGIKASLSGGLVAPILLYPHHFDLSLVWFPWDDERQLSLGWSTGDETIREPYIYLTAYPEPPGFTDLELPDDAYWQTKGFSGAILPYASLQASRQPDDLLQSFALDTFTAGKKLFA